MKWYGIPAEGRAERRAEATTAVVVLEAEATEMGAGGMEEAGAKEAWVAAADIEEHPKALWEGKSAGAALEEVRSAEVAQVAGSAAGVLAVVLRVAKQVA